MSPDDAHEGEGALKAGNAGFGEHLFRSVVETATVGVVVVDRAGRIVFVNLEVESLFGFSSGELIGQSLELLVPERLRSRHTTLHAHLHEPHATRALGAGRDLIGLRKDGVEIPVEIGLRRIESDGQLFVVASVVDIRERRLAEQALRDRDERYQTLIEATFDGIAISQDGVLREANNGFAQIFGYDSVEEVIGRRIDEFVADESREDVGRRMLERIEGSYELVGKRKDGRKIWLQATARTQRLGGLPARITALRDVSERRLLEQQVRQQQKMEAVGRLAGGIAHDFNNMLTVIQSYTSMLLAEVAESGGQHPELEEIQRAAERATTLTRQLLAFSRQQVLDPKVLSPNKVVAEAEKMLKRLIGDDVELTIVAARDAGRIRADAGQLEQVIVNLAINARDAMPDGGTCTIETSNVEMGEQFVREHYPATAGRYLMLTVSDTGTGMSEETKAHIFEPFFTTKEMGKGTGLGLATVYAIVKQSGGFIWVYSEPGRGTVFKLYFPLVDEPEEATGPARSAARVRGTETVLLVEDSAAVRSVARRLLEKQGYTVLEATDAQVAVALAGAHRGDIHLLLTDLVMPGMGGTALAELLAVSRPGLRVLYTSGYTDDTVMRQRLLDGRAKFLQKPFTAESLLRMVRTALRSTPLGGPAQADPP